MLAISLFFLLQLFNVQITNAQMDQMEPLDLSMATLMKPLDLSVRKENGNQMELATSTIHPEENSLVKFNCLLTMAEQERSKLREPNEAEQKVSTQENRSTEKLRGSCKKEVTDANEDVRIHKQQHKCLTCGKTFDRAWNLKIHERTHSGKKPYKCLICGDTFGHSSNLKVHERIHTRERPYKCSECGKTFVHATSLKKHEGIHTDEGPYKCSMCGKAFAYASKLTTHARSHSREKPFKCRTCDKTFGYASNLNAHENIHADQKQYNCSTCGKRF